MHVVLGSEIQNDILTSVLKPVREKISEFRKALSKHEKEIESAIFIGNEELRKARDLCAAEGMLQTASISVKFKTATRDVGYHFDSYVAGAPKGFHMWGDGKLAAKSAPYATPPLIIQPIIEEMAKTLDDYYKLKSELEELFTKAKSVQDIHKIWPSVVEHLSESTRERFYRKPAPRGKNAEKPELALSDDATVSLAKIRLGAV